MTMEQDNKKEIEELRLELRLLQKDHENIREMYRKIEESIEKLVSVGNRMEVALVSQERTLSSMESVLKTADQTQLKKDEATHKTLDKHEEKIASLEKFRWISVGGWLLLLALSNIGDTIKSWAN